MNNFFIVQLTKIKKYILSDIKSDIKKDIDIEKILLGKVLIENIRNKKNIDKISEVEFKVFS